MNLTWRERASLTWQAIKGNLDTRKGSLVESLMSGIWPSVGGEPPKRQIKQYLDTYNQMPWARTPVSRIATAVSMLHWRLYYEVGNQQDELGRRRAIRNYSLQRMAVGQRKSALRDAIDIGKVKEVETHILLDALHAGNAMLAGQANWKVSQSHMNLVGETYWMKERNTAGGPTAFWVLPPHWILDTPTPTNPYFRVSFRAWQGLIPQSEIVWFKDPDPVNPYGRGSGTAQALGDELETDEYAAKFIKQFFYNDATPKFMVYPKGDMNNMGEDQVKNLERRWLNEHQGFWRMGKARFMNREVGIHEFTQNFEHLQFSELRSRSRDTSLQVYGINPEITGVIENCHDAETECLTKRGWVSHADLLDTDEVATWNHACGRLEYQQPTEIHVYQHAGPMHRWKGARIDAFVTPGHRMWRSDKYGAWAFRTSEEHASEKGWYQWKLTGGGYAGRIQSVVIPPHTSLRPTRRPDETEPHVYHPEEFAYFLGIFIAEGCATQSGVVSISQNEGPIAEKIGRAMHELSLSSVRYRSRKNAKGLHWCTEHSLTHKGLAYWLIDECGHGAKNKHLPADVFDWPQSAQEILIDGLVDGDGSRRPNGAESYGSSSQRLLDDIQRLLIQMGYPAYVTQKNIHGVGSVEFRRSTRTNKIGDHTLTTVGNYGSDAAWMSIEHYEGPVWCVTVPNGLFFTRRKGKVICHGNSNRATIDGAAYFFQKFVVEPWAEFWRSEMQQKIVADYDARLIIDYDSPVQDDRSFTLQAYQAKPGAVMVDEWRKLQGLQPLGEANGGNLRFQPINENLEDGFTVTPPPEPLPTDQTPSQLAAAIHSLTDKQLEELAELTKGKM